MNLLCLDLEGVLVPEIWIAFAEVTGIPFFRRTTRDEPDYGKLMRERIACLASHGLKLADIRSVIARIDPLPGAKDFLEEARRIGEVAILSDTFTQFAGPLMEKLGRPTLFCNDLVVADDGTVTDFRLRQSDGKRKAVEAFKSLAIRVMAAGDSFNDLGMIGAADTGALFRTTPAIAAAHPEVPAYETYADLLAHFRRFASAA